MVLLMLNESAYKRDEDTGSVHFQKICVYCFFYFLLLASLFNKEGEYAYFSYLCFLST